MLRTESLKSSGTRNSNFDFRLNRLQKCGSHQSIYIIFIFWRSSLVVTLDNFYKKKLVNLMIEDNQLKKLINPPKNSTY